MASKFTQQFEKNISKSLKEMGLSRRGDLCSERALSTGNYDMQDMFRIGDRVNIWQSELVNYAGYENSDGNIEAEVVAVSRRLVTVRYIKSNWTEAFDILDYLMKRIYHI